MQDAFLGTYQRQDLRLSIKIHIIPALIETGHRLSKFWRSHRGLITVGIGLMRHLTEFLDGLLRRRHIGTTDSETDNILALGIHLSHFLQLPTEIVFAH